MVTHSSATCNACRSGLGNDSGQRHRVHLLQHAAYVDNLLSGELLHFFAALVALQQFMEQPLRLLRGCK